MISSEEAHSSHPSTPGSWDHWNLLCHWDIKKPHKVLWEASQPIAREQKGEILWGPEGRWCSYPCVTYPCVTLADGCWGEILLFSDQNKNMRSRLFTHELLWLSFLFFCILHDMMVDFYTSCLVEKKTCLIWGVLGWKLSENWEEKLSLNINQFSNLKLESFGIHTSFGIRWQFQITELARSNNPKICKLLFFNQS